MKCLECSPKGLKKLKWVFGRCERCGKSSLVADTPLNSDGDGQDLFDNIFK